MSDISIIHSQAGICPLTIYKKPHLFIKASLLYFHGGGLLYGSREDLPALHLEMLTEAGFEIVAFDYPLAPAAKLDEIQKAVQEGILQYINNLSSTEDSSVSRPYFLWGRSAGAYLCLLAAAKGNLTPAPSGILSWYGYGFMTDDWFLRPAEYYCSLPKVPKPDWSSVPARTCGSLEQYYSLYVYARQQGLWKDLIYEGRDKFFYLDHTLRIDSPLPCPLFAAHSTQDPDVPFAEFQALCAAYQADRYLVFGKIHDFDRDTQDPKTRKLLEQSIRFLEKQIK